MKYFFFRNSCILLLMIIFLVHTYYTDASLTAAFFICTVILTLYFITPLLKKLRILSYIMIVLILFCSLFFSLHIMYVLPILAFFIMEGAFLLQAKFYYFFIGSLTVIGLIFVLLQWLPLYGLLMLIILSVCSLVMRHYMQAYSEKNILYKELLGQYRALKRLSVEQDQLVRAEERTKIARDIHDSVGHNLTALLMQAEMISIQYGHDALDDIKQLARKSLNETRYAVRQLKSSEAYGISSVLHLIRRLEMESRLHIRFTIEKGVMSLPISNKQSIVLYRVLQECLTNAMKYSDSKEVDIILGKDSLQQISFQVKNKSMKQSPLVHGFGLKNMTERIQEIGGELRIYKTAQQFIVDGSFPMKERA